MLQWYINFYESTLRLYQEIFHLLLEPINPNTLEERMEVDIQPVLQITHIEQFSLRSRSDKSIEELRQERF